MNDTAKTFREVAVQVMVLANDTDPDGDALTIVSVSTPGDGTASHNGTRVTYTPRLGFLGTDTFMYTIKDPAGATATARVTVTVEEKNREPSAFDDDVEGGKSGASFNVITGAGTFNGTGNADFDPDGDPLTIDAFTFTFGGAMGTLTCQSNGNCVWAANGNCSSISGMTTYKLKDDRGGSDIGDIFLSATLAC